MPEGVEVSLFSRSLNEYLKNKTITEIDVLSGRYTKKSIEGLSNFKQQLPLVINTVENKGKFIYFTFKNNNIVMFNTLGMTGGWSTIPSENNHDRIKFKVIDEFERIEYLYFRDIRNFGTMHFKNQIELNKKLKSIGFDIVQDNLSYNDFYITLLKYPRMNICELLMRQDIFSGVGNYIKAEALWFANIHPDAIPQNLSYEDVCLLYDGLKNVINKSFKSGGATIKDYFRFNNKEKTEDFFDVYGKRFDSNGFEIIRTETSDGRTTHWVPSKQIKGIV